MRTAKMIATIAVSVLGGCSYQQPDYLTMLAPAELRQITQNADVLLVDVHTPEQQHIKGTDLFIPYDQVDANLGKLPQDKETPIYLYCRTGHMANVAARTLHDLGYRKLFNLAGGTEAWRTNGYEFQ